MAELAGISGQEAAKVFCRIGYVVVRQKGSHVRLTNSQRKEHPLTIPLHKELKLGLLKRLIQDAGISNEKFLELL